MSENKISAPKGTFDVLPEDATLRDGLINGIAAKLFRQFGYGRIETPIFENRALFERGVGQTTDIVEKEMFTFEDQGGRSMALRPEGTAAVCRAYVENGMHKVSHPVKLWYFGPFFRQEAPQAGRFRQFTQIGAEVFGDPSPFIDAELIQLVDQIIADAGLTNVTLRLNSIGSKVERGAYSVALTSFLESRSGELSDDVRRRMNTNPLRAFDSKDPGTQAVMKDAPLLQDFLSADDKGYHETVRWLLKGLVDSKTLNATLVHDPTLVRGLDYYEKTVFEFVSDELGAQSALAGGGRYDGLITQLGGPPSGGIGWAAGVERIISIANHEVLRAFSDAGPTLFIADEGEGDFVKSMVLAVNWRLRDEDRVAIFGDAKRSLRNQLKKADRLGADFVVIVGGERGAYDATIRNMRSGNQSDVNSNEEDFVGTVMSEIERLTMETSR